MQYTVDQKTKLKQFSEHYSLYSYRKEMLLSMLLNGFCIGLCDICTVKWQALKLVFLNGSHKIVLYLIPIIF